MPNIIEILKNCVFGDIFGKRDNKGAVPINATADYLPDRYPLQLVLTKKRACRHSDHLKAIVVLLSGNNNTPKLLLYCKKLLFTFNPVTGIMIEKKAVMRMNQFEKINHQITPSYWDSSRLIVPKSIGTCNTIYPYCFSRVNLDSYLLLYTVNGKGQLEYDGGLYPLQCGDLFFIDCNKAQTYKAVAGNWDFAFIHTSDTEDIAHYYAAITQSGKNPVFHYAAFMTDCWEKLYKDITENRPESLVRASLCLISLFLNLLELSKQTIPKDLEIAASYIKMHYNENISLYDLANMAHLSKYHFIRRFYQFYNVTPHEYLQLCRMDHAKSQLICTNDSIEDIALLCGYTSASAFCQSFKKHHTVSPSAFRKQMKIL